MKKYFIILLSLFLLLTSIYCQPQSEDTNSVQQETYPIPHFLVEKDYIIINKYIINTFKGVYLNDFFDGYYDYSIRILKNNLSEDQQNKFNNLRIPEEVYNTLELKINFENTFRDAYQKRIDYIRETFIRGFNENKTCVVFDKKTFSIFNLSNMNYIELYYEYYHARIIIHYEEKEIKIIDLEDSHLSIDKNGNLVFSPYSNKGDDNNELPDFLEDLKQFGL